ncbi:OPT/YSL family transporter [Collinsella stercoris]|uniref:Oligopeptide transporter, OPT superfamily n=1 Tax=Collinsella stercoris DSM 13279 TaxID=445975 RepID=B6G8Z3_9ACTN|nr:OPT/YSL family transporter [Collinsella stercoris]EEA91280.1 oligopeptide transporter, OPT superfamily [Collinsella stercoris DSM 13279]UEA44628.1 OPT/YSL family transporter [Collinsella stercoris DSM 13279]UWP10907.1 OPT/YSL family transporter [Collinsella stercoris]
MSSINERTPWRGQISAAGILIGCIGCVIITASSVYTALKMGALPWPTIFTSITALVLLRALGHTSLNEANVTQIIMSAGSMVAGGLAFTIPGIWMLGSGHDVSWIEMLGVALAGTLLGLVCTALIRRRFVEESDLEYPIGTAAAETLMASRAGGATGKKLFGSMAAAGLWCALRDLAGVIPTMLCALPIPGVAFGIYNSPMLLSVGFLVGGAAVAFWLAGGFIANLGIIVGGSAAGLWDVTVAQGIVSSLGMGLMMGSGLGVVVHDILPKAANLSSVSLTPGANGTRAQGGALALFVAAAALLICLILGIAPLHCIIVVVLTFVTTIMSAQSVGQTGIDPMEIFGLIVLLIIAALGESNQVKLFFVAGVVAVACGLAGDVMSDFKTGHILGTSPRAMWIGQAIGALLGAVVSVAVMAALLTAYGPESFGPGKLFVSAQASVVATMVSGIPSVPAFLVGLGAGTVLYCLGIPSMMLGLGVYLPFYMTISATLGACVKWAYDRIAAHRDNAANARSATCAPANTAASTGNLRSATGDNTSADNAPEITHEESGIIIASGVLGGESIVGVIIALMSVAGGLMG